MEDGDFDLKVSPTHVNVRRRFEFQVDGVMQAVEFDVWVDRKAKGLSMTLEDLHVGSIQMVIKQLQSLLPKAP